MLGGVYNEDLLSTRRIRFLNIFSLIGCSMLLLFGIINIREAAVIPGAIEVIIAMLGLVNVVALRMTKHLHTAIAVLLTLMIVVLSVLLFTGGIANTGVFWFFTFPVLAFFLEGAADGFIWISMVFFLLLSTWILQSLGSIVTPYPDIVLRQLSVSLFVSTVLIYIYETINEQSTAVLSKEKEVEHMKTEFITLASHQLRTPLTEMRWLLELLEDEDVQNLSPKQQKMLSQVRGSNDRMGVILDALLNISRLGARELKIHPETTNLNTLADEVIAEMSARFQAKSIHFVFTKDENLPSILTDRKLIQQAYVNFLSNSLKYTPQGGHVTLQISATPTDIVSTLKDTGYGIPKDMQHRVFTRFFRGENIISIDTEGTGLGLYLTKEIVEACGGKVGFESEEGKGSTFWFSLPLNAQS